MQLCNKNSLPLCLCNMTHPYIRHDPSMCATCRIQMCDMTHSCVWHDSFICVTWLIHMCDMTHSYVWHDSIIRVAWLIHVCDTTQLHVRHDVTHLNVMGFTHVWTWGFIYVCNMCYSLIYCKSWVHLRMTTVDLLLYQLGTSDWMRFMCTYTDVYTHTFICMYMYIYVYVYVHTYMYMYIHMYIYL